MMTDANEAQPRNPYLNALRRFGPPILLVGLLVAAGYLAQRSGVNGGGGPVGGPVGGDASTALARYGFHFTEVSKASGIDFTHEAPTFDPKLKHIMPQVAAMGAAVSVMDVDGDGWLDLYAVDSAEGSLNRLYRNKGDGTFEDIAGAVGLADVNPIGSGVSAGSVWGDFDNDGDSDVFLYKWGKSELYRNDDGKHFTPIGAAAGVPAWANINSATWLDYDGDGLLDLFFAGYYGEAIDLWKLTDTRMMPDSFEYAENGGRRYLYHNLGNGAFEDVTEQAGIVSRRWALAVAAADLRGTGHPDIVVANDYGVSEYWANDGHGHFTDIGADSGIGYRPKSGMNVSFGDIYNDGRRGIYISNISEQGVLMQGNNLWLPREGAPADAPKFDNLASSLGVELGGWSFGAQFGDLNNDGHTDLFLTNGYVSQNKDKSYWYDYSKIAGGNSAIISDAANWPAMDDTSLAGYQPKRVWLNDGTGQFTDVAQQVGVTDTFDGRAVVLADLWHRGVLDVVVAHQRGPLQVYKNEVAADRHWIAFDLKGAGAVNRDAIGAQVVLHWAGQQQRQEVLAASGYCSQNMRQLHFGLGDAAAVESADIRWPDGTQETITAPAVDQVHTITAGQPAAQSR
ncbi:MAG: CRTAC1 family protein [Ardenticatenales bacterium]